MSESERELLAEALDVAWTDFADDVRSSLAGDGLSMSMEWRIEWIGKLSEAIGPISWEQVEIPLLEAGWYQRVHEQLGHPVPQEEIDEWLSSRIAGSSQP